MTWKISWNAKSRPSCKPPYSRALDYYCPVGPDCQLARPRYTAMPYHHYQLRRRPAASPRVPRRPAPPPGDIKLRGGGMTLLGDDARYRTMRYQRFSKKPATGR